MHDADGPQPNPAFRTADMMSLSNVHRWTVIATNRHQSVAEHSYNVAAISLELMERITYQTPLQAHTPSYLAAVYWALVHDIPETFTGDIDGKFKREFPSVREAVQSAENQAFPWVRYIADVTPPWVRYLVKAADNIEAIHFIQIWGVGLRASAVRDELEAILFNETLPALIETLRLVNHPIGIEYLTLVVRQVLFHSVRETHCYQMRSMRVEK